MGGRGIDDLGVLPMIINSASS